MRRKFDLEDRLVRFAANVVRFTGTFSTGYAAINLSEKGSIP